MNDKRRHHLNVTLTVGLMAASAAEAVSSAMRPGAQLEVEDIQSVNHVWSDEGAKQATATEVVRCAYCDCPIVGKMPCPCRFDPVISLGLSPGRCVDARTKEQLELDALKESRVRLRNQIDDMESEIHQLRANGNRLAEELEKAYQARQEMQRTIMPTSARVFSNRSGLRFSVVVEASHLDEVRMGQARMWAARDGWNGKGLKVVPQFPDLHSKMTSPYWYIEYPDGTRCPWLPSQTDVFATDWVMVVEDLDPGSSAP